METSAVGGQGGFSAGNGCIAAFHPTRRAPIVPNEGRCNANGLQIRHCIQSRMQKVRMPHWQPLACRFKCYWIRLICHFWWRLSTGVHAIPGMPFDLKPQTIVRCWHPPRHDLNLTTAQLIIFGEGWAVSAYATEAQIINLLRQIFQVIMLNLLPRANCASPYHAS